MQYIIEENAKIKNNYFFIIDFSSNVLLTPSSDVSKIQCDLVAHGQDFPQSSALNVKKFPYDAIDGVYHCENEISTEMALVAR